MGTERAMAMVPMQALLEDEEGRDTGCDPAVETEVVAEQRHPLEQQMEQRPTEQRPVMSTGVRVT